MPASVLLYIFLAFLAGAALVPVMNLIRKRKDTGNTTDSKIQPLEIQENSDSLNDGASGMLSEPSGQTTDLSRMESVIRGISAPLNAMIGNMELIEPFSFSEEQRKRWRAVRLASDALLRKVSDALEYCNLESDRLLVELMDFDACEMVARSIAPFIDKAASKNIGIHMRCAQFPIFVRNDQIRISQILGHVLENSIQFAHEGFITVSIESELHAPEQQLLRIVVEDSGNGIAAEFHEKLLDPFMGSTRPDENIGLGLAICKILCNKLDASISVASTPGSGSRFTMEFPCRPSLSAHPRNAVHHNALKGHSAIFICAVREWHDNIVPHLEHWGLKVDAYADPAMVDRSRVKAASCVVLFCASGQWSAKAENEVAAQAAYIIEASESNPIEMKKTGRTILLSCYSLGSLFKAFEHVARSLKPVSELTQSPPSYSSAAPPAHVVEAFKKSLKTSLRNIQLSIISDNGVMVLQELHNLSGSLAVLNSPELSRTCIDLETRIKMEGLSPALMALETLMQRLTSHLDEDRFSMRF